MKGRSVSVKSAMGPPPLPIRKLSLRERLEELHDKTSELRVPAVKRAMTTGIIGNLDLENMELSEEESDDYQIVKQGDDKDESVLAVAGCKEAH